MDQSFVHPLDHQEVTTFIENEFDTGLVDKLLASPRAHLSTSPNDLEKTEAWAIQQRRYRMFGEEIIEWLGRTLYEETYGVLYAPTIGGILSHYNRHEQFNNIEISGRSLVQKLLSFQSDLMSLGYKEALQVIKSLAETERLSLKDFRDFVQQFLQISLPVNIPNARAFDMIPWDLKDPGFLSRPRFDKYVRNGWLFLKVFHYYEKVLMSTCSDEQLLQMLGKRTSQNRLSVLCTSWNYFGGYNSPVLANTGNFKRASDEGFVNGVRELAVLRSSEDFDFLYSTYSATGALNNLKK